MTIRQNRQSHVVRVGHIANIFVVEVHVHLDVDRVHHLRVPVWWSIKHVVDRHPGVYQNWLANHGQLGAARAGSWKNCLHLKVVGTFETDSLAGCWLDVHRIVLIVQILDFYYLLPLPLFSRLQTHKRIVKDSLCSFPSMPVFSNICNLIFQCHWYPLNFWFPLPVIQNTVHFSLLPRSICIFLEITSDSSDTLITTTTWFYIGLHLFLVVADRCGFSYYHLTFGFDCSESVG